MKIKMGMVIVGMTAVAFAGWQGYLHGHRVAEGDHAERVAQSLQHQRQLVAQLRERDTQREVVYRDRVRTIQTVADPSDCADTELPDDIRRVLNAGDAGD